MIRWPRILKHTIFGVIIALVILDAGIAWIFVRSLTQPACQRHPNQLAGFPAPQEYGLRTADDLALRAWYYPSQNGAAVVAAGGPGGALGSQLPRISPLLEAGFGVMQLDTRACADPPSAVTLGYDESQDVLAALIFLQSRAEVDPSRIGAIGFSMGGVGVLRAAARHPGLAAVVAEGGYFNLGDDIVDADRPTGFVQKAFLYTVAGAYWIQTGVNPWGSSPIDDLPAINPRPVLLIYGEYEAAAGRAKLQYASALDPKELWIVPKGSHGSNHLVAPQEYDRRILAFFARSLLNH